MPLTQLPKTVEEAARILMEKRATDPTLFQQYVQQPFNDYVANPVANFISQQAQSRLANDVRSQFLDDQGNLTGLGNVLAGGLGGAALGGAAGLVTSPFRKRKAPLSDMAMGALLGGMGGTALGGIAAGINLATTPSAGQLARQENAANSAYQSANEWNESTIAGRIGNQIANPTDAGRRFLEAGGRTGIAPAAYTIGGMLGFDALRGGANIGRSVLNRMRNSPTTMFGRPNINNLTNRYATVIAESPELLAGRGGLNSADQQIVQRVLQGAQNNAGDRGLSSAFVRNNILSRNVPAHPADRAAASAWNRAYLSTVSPQRTWWQRLTGRQPTASGFISPSVVRQIISEHGLPTPNAGGALSLGALDTPATRDAVNRRFPYRPINPRNIPGVGGLVGSPVMRYGVLPALAQVGMMGANSLFHDDNGLARYVQTYSSGPEGIRDPQQIAAAFSRNTGTPLTNDLIAQVTRLLGQ